MRTLCALTISSLLVVAAACSDDSTSNTDGGGPTVDTTSDSPTTPPADGHVDTTSADMGEEICYGCFAGGTCVAGDSVDACGQLGVVCQQCGMNDTCQQGLCVPAVVCDENNCAGCCASDGTCQLGTTVGFCGASGMACEACTGTDVCRDQRCVADSTCGDTCIGCCNGDTCMLGTDDGTCGYGGQSCETCAVGLICKPWGDGGYCGSDPAKRWDLVLIDATVPAVNLDGDSWDVFDGLPDVAVRAFSVTSGGTITQGYSDVVDDTLTPVWNQAVWTDIPGSDFGYLKFHLYDDDGFTPKDTIGFCPPSIYNGADVDFSGATLECKVDADPSLGRLAFSVRYKIVPHVP